MQCKWKFENKCRICKKELPLKRSKHFDKSKCAIELKKIAANELKPCRNNPFLLKEILRGEKNSKVGEEKENFLKCNQCNSKFDSHAIYFQHKVSSQFYEDTQVFIQGYVIKQVNV